MPWDHRGHRLATFIVSSFIVEKRVALVIGNGAYASAPRLRNPTNDAQDVAEALKRIGFEIILGLNLDRAGMDDHAVRFARARRQHAILPERLARTSPASAAHHAPAP
jgi:Caspase domain